MIAISFALVIMKAGVNIGVKQNTINHPIQLQFELKP